MSTPDLTLDGLETIFMEHHRFVRAIAYKIVGDMSQAEDVAQEVFISLHRELSRRPEGIRIHTSTRAYLARCTTNAALNARRADGRRADMQGRLLTDAEAVTPTAPAADEHIVRRERAAIVNAALAELSERDRLLLILRYSGLSYREVAEALEVKETSVGKLIERAHVRFAVIYRGLGGGGEL